MAYPILILAYRRKEELEKVLASIEALNPSKVYIHLHDAPNEAHQKEVEAVKALVRRYSGQKDLKYIKEPLGVRKSMYSALEWIASKEEVFMVFEDDVVLKDGSKEELLAAMARLKEEGGILKFGPHPKMGVFWGWATNSETAKKIISTDITSIPYEEMKPYFEDKYHYRGIMELFRREMHQAWDDEFDMIAKVTGVNIIETENVITEHIGKVSTRTDNGIDIGFGVGSHVMFVNGKMVN